MTFEGSRVKIFFIDILLIITQYNILQLFILSRNRKSRLYLLHSLPVLLAGIPTFFAAHSFYFQYSYIPISAGLLLYPLTLMAVIMDYYPVDKTRHLLRWAIPASFCITFSFFNLNWNYNLVIAFNLAVYIYILIILRDKIFIRTDIVSVVIISIIAVLWNLFSASGLQSLVLLIISFYLATSFILLYNYSKRADSINRRITNLTALNKRFDQIITRQKQNIDQLKKIIAQKDIELLQVARHASLAEVTTGIAHELAQPLTGIKCISQNIVDDINYNELDLMQAVADLTKISALVDRSSSIIDHIRTFSRKRGFFIQPADLNACILNAVELVSNQLKNSEIELVFILDDSIPAIYGDTLSLEQLFINMILNSRDAIITRREKNREITGVIKIKTFSGDGNVTLVIEDNGGGIPDDIIPKIWTPFFTTKKKGKGTGIGLSLSHRIIREHNAEVAVQNSGAGTVFTITFPSEKPASRE